MDEIEIYVLLLYLALFTVVSYLFVNVYISGILLGLFLVTANLFMSKLKE